MATKRVYVYRNTAIDDYRVFPPVIVLGHNDKFQVVNTVANHDAFLTIPDDPFEGGPVKGEKIPAKGKSGEKQPKAGTFGVEYEVKVDGKKAEGNSDPVIIIDPS